MNKQTNILLYTTRKRARLLAQQSEAVAKLQADHQLVSDQRDEVMAMLLHLQGHMDTIGNDLQCLIESVEQMGAAAVLETDIEGMAYYIVPAAAMEAVLYHFAPSGAIEVEE